MKSLLLTISCFAVWTENSLLKENDRQEEKGLIAQRKKCQVSFVINV